MNIDRTSQADDTGKDRGDVPIATAAPVLSYGNLKVIARVNPPAIGGLICAVLALPLIAAGAYSVFTGNLYDWALVATIGLASLLVLGFGTLGLWLSRDPTLVVSGRRLSLIAILVGVLTGATSMLAAADNLMYAPLPRMGPPPVTDAACQQNLTQIAAALRDHAAANDGRYPASLDVLKGPDGKPLTLTCPATNAPYLFAVPNALHEGLSPKRVVVFDALTNHGLPNHSIGRHVLRPTGEIEFVFDSSELWTLRTLEAAAPAGK